MKTRNLAGLGQSRFCYQAKEIIENCRDAYNNHRPYRIVNYLKPNWFNNQELLLNIFLKYRGKVNIISLLWGRRESNP
jgi:hypothetical protein